MKMIGVENNKYAINVKYIIYWNTKNCNLQVKS